MSYEDTLKAEVASWLIPDEAERAEKFKRERIRHYKLLRDLKLDVLGTEEMDILEVGGGPMPVSDLLRFRSRTVIDPLGDQYRTVLPCPDHVGGKGEDIDAVNAFDLAIATNSLDHTENPSMTLHKMCRALSPTGYLAIAGAENNAITHPHPAHVHNLTADWVHRRTDFEFETVWELTYARDGFRYGWRLYEGRRGQPAFALLMRRCG
jgi:hypothetical protein